MFLEQAVQAVHRATTDGIVTPLYGSFCFSEIVPYIHSHFSEGQSGSSPLAPFTPNGQDASVVILLFIDGFGWHLYERLADKIPLLKKLARHGTIGPLTSQFPSTTAAHVTSFHAGIPVTQTGIFEWTMYEPLLGRVIEPLTFHYLRRDDPPVTFNTACAPQDVFPFSMHYEKLSTYGTMSHILTDSSISGSQYSQRMHQGALTTPFNGLIDGLNKLNHIVQSASGQTFIYFYFDLLDSLAHRNGPFGPKVYAAAHELFKKLDRDLFQSETTKDKKPLILLTADHGQIGASPTNTLYLDELCPKILSHIRRDPTTNELLTPVGSPRDLFLFLKRESKLEAIDSVRKALAERALVLTTEEAIARGYWGPSPSSRLLDRIGDAVVLPNAGETVWIREGGLWQTRFVGYHGGLAPEEMIIPFISWVYQ